MRDLLDDESENPFKKCSTSEERKLIEAKVYELLQWMSDEAEGRNEKMGIPDTSTRAHINHPAEGSGGEEFEFRLK